MHNIKNNDSIEVVPKQIKKTMKFKDSDVLHINIKYPEIKSNNKVKKIKKINDFYDAAAKKFIRLCEKKLYGRASSAITADEEFKPFGAVMAFEKKHDGHNDPDILRIYLDIYIFTGKGRGNTIRKAQSWRLSDGDLI